MKNNLKCLLCESTEGSIIFNIPNLSVFLGVHESKTHSEKKVHATLRYCNKCGFVQQQYSQELAKFLCDIYQSNGFITTPPGYSSWGNARAQSLIKFIDENLERPQSILEIGCHAGYLLSNLQKKYKCKAVGIEPANIKNTPKNVAIIQDFFPTSKLSNKKFDLVLCQTVLEHILTPKNFLKSISKHIADNGILLISVPNCTKTFSEGDIGLFLHEHISYFTKHTLRRMLNLIGFNCVTIDASKAELRVVAKLEKIDETSHLYDTDIAPLQYEKKVGEKINFFKEIIINEEKTGLYGACGLTHNLLQITKLFEKVILYDGDEYKYGKYLLDVPTPIHKWNQILSDPISKVIIMPYAFQEEIYNFLISKGLNKKIIKLY